MYEYLTSIRYLSLHKNISDYYQSQFVKKCVYHNPLCQIYWKHLWVVFKCYSICVEWDSYEPTWRKKKMWHEVQCDEKSEMNPILRYCDQITMFMCSWEIALFIKENLKQITRKIISLWFTQIYSIQTLMYASWKDEAKQA